MNSRIAWSYERWELWEVRLLRTAVFDCPRSGSFRMVLGLSLRFLLAIQTVCTTRRPAAPKRTLGRLRRSIQVDKKHFYYKAVSTSIFTAPLASRLYEQRFGKRNRTRQVVAGFGGA